MCGSFGRDRETVYAFHLEVVDGLRVPVDRCYRLDGVRGGLRRFSLNCLEAVARFQLLRGEGAAVGQVEPVLGGAAEQEPAVGVHLDEVVRFSCFPRLADLSQHRVSGVGVAGDGERQRSFVHRGQRVDADAACGREDFGVAGEAARIRCVDPGRVRARVPVVDGRVELHPRVAALVRALGDPAYQVPCLVRVDDPALAVDGARVPLAVVEHRAHELVGDPDAVVRVLEEHRGVGRSGQRPVVAGVDQRPGLAFLLGLAVDEGEDVGVVRIEDHHLRRAAPPASRLDDAGEGVVALHEGNGSGGDAAARDGLSGRANGGQVAAGAGAVLEEHALGLGQLEDRLHRVADAEDEARGALTVLVPADVEPDGAVERGLLVHHQVGELVAERLAVLGCGEVAVVGAPPGDRVDDSGDELPDAVLAIGGARVPAEVLVGDDVGRLLGPALRDLDAFLPEDGFAVRVLDRGRAGLPFDAVVDRARRDVPGERPGEGESGRLRRAVGACSGLCHRYRGFVCAQARSVALASRAPVRPASCSVLGPSLRGGFRGTDRVRVRVVGPAAVGGALSACLRGATASDQCRGSKSGLSERAREADTYYVDRAGTVWGLSARAERRGPGPVATLGRWGDSRACGAGRLAPALALATSGGSARAERSRGVGVEPDEQ